MISKVIFRKSLLVIALFLLWILHLDVTVAANYQSRDDADVTALMRATRDGEHETLKALLNQGVDLNAKDSYGWTALYYATIRRDLSAVKALLDKGADVNAKTDNGSTALQSAAQSGHSAMVKELVEKGADVNQSDDSGTTPLMSAASSGRSDLVKYLLAKGADVNASNKRGYTALTIAQNARHTDVVELIKKSGGIEKQVANPDQKTTQQDATKPVLLNRARPSYTTEAREKGEQGIVRVRVLIGKDGTVKKVRIISGLAYGLSYQAMEAAYQLRFKPATKDGQPVDFWMPVIIEFNIGR